MALLAPACGFTAPTDDGTGDGDPNPTTVDPNNPFPPGDDDDSTDPGPPPGAVTRHCSTQDQALRLCIDFDDTAQLAGDGSPYHHATTADMVTVMTRKSEMAVQVSQTSRVTVAEHQMLDITDNLTITMWAKPDAFAVGQSRWLLDNNTQYFVEYLPGGKFRCGVGTTTVDSPTVVTNLGSWYHVACTYNRQQLRIYINGHIADCRNGTAAIPSGGNEGIAIGSNVDAGPTYSQPFVGGLDNVQVFARAFTSGQMCDAANNHNCINWCPVFH